MINFIVKINVKNINICQEYLHSIKVIYMIAIIMGITMENISSVVKTIN
jgi:hypothetical protein